MPELALYLLGPPRVELDGQPVSLGRRKAVALLAYLALTSQPHTRDALATLLWLELDQTGARGQLRRTLSLLNRTLGSGWLNVDRETAQWAPEGEAWIDIERLRDCLAACAAHGHPPEQACAECVPLLSEAIDLYQDGFLAGFTLPDAPAFDEWQFFEGEELREGVSDALQRLVRWYGDRGEVDAAIPYARRWLALDPLHEPAQRELMALYAHAGQRAAALRQYAECERVLEAELGVPPSPETAQLYERIRDREDLPETGSLAETRFLHNLPTSLTPFVGRKEELAELSRLLADPDVRLLTVLGPGGSGKTRLALEAAAGELGSHEHGVFYVPLAPLQSAEAIVPAVAQALGCTFYGRGDPRQQLLDYLRQRDVLLVLDNLEHLLDGVDLIDEVLRGAPDVKVLATSRARLSVRGEHLYHVRGMDYPRDDRGTTGIRLGDYDAVSLFLRSACRAQEEYEPTDNDLVHIAQICRMVEGMPLAILLAATWVDALSLAEITVQIERGLDFLETDWRGVAERHHSMRAVFDASFELLTGLEREVFARLSVFRGGFTAEAAGAVAGADLRVLRGLVRKSFLQRGQTGRYEVHELLRQYGGGRLDERPSEKEHVLNLHGAYYAEFLYRRETNMWKGSQEALPEIENIRTAMHWATMHRKVAEIHKCLSGLSLYGPLGLNQEGKNACGKAIDALRIGQADELNEEREAALAMALVLQGFFSAALGPIDQVQELVQEGLSVLRRLGDQRKLMWGYSLAVAAGTVQDLSEARQILEKSLTISREMDDYSTMSRALWLLGRIALTQGAHREAEQYCREALAISRRNDDRGGASSALAFLGHTLYVRGEYARARQCYEESLDLRNELGKAMTTGRLYQHLGDVALAMGDYEEAREHHQQALAVYRDGDAYWIEERVVLGGCWGIPVSLQTLGDVALATGDTVEAKQYYRRGLQMARDESYVELRLHLLLGPIKWLARRGNVEGAVELAALARHHPASIEETRGKAEELLHGLQAELPSEAYAAAEERGRARDLRATVEELLEELEGMESE